MSDERYAEPLDPDRLAREQAAERARICHRLETMWQGLQTDIEAQRDGSERGVDPRLQQLQLQTLKLQAQLWRMLGTPISPPEPEPDPAVAAESAQAAAEAALDRITNQLKAAEKPQDGTEPGT